METLNMEINLTDLDSLIALETLVENERKRCQGWMSKFGMSSNEGEMYLFRCKRLAAIRENVRMLRETYE
jgi:hypothetical protein